MKKILSASGTILLCLPAFAQFDSYDPTFGTAGIVQTSFSPTNDVNLDLEAQPDGKLIVAGYSDLATPDATIARYNTNGTPDNTFGTGGSVTTDFLGGDDLFNAICIQSDGKILAAGRSYSMVEGYEVLVVRYLADGTSDPTFDTDGVVYVSLAGGQGASGITLQDDGKIVLCAYDDNGIVTIRLNADGSLDSSFDVDGIVNTVIGINPTTASVKLQPDGKILVCGKTLNISNTDFFVARYNADGSPDASFDADGVVITAVGALDDFCTDLFIQADGKIVAAGYSYFSNHDYSMVRYNADGTLDNLFGTLGKVTTDISGSQDLGRRLYIDDSGRIMLTGTVGMGPTSDFNVAVYTPDGVLDTQFDGDGLLTLDITGAFESSSDSFVQEDGKLVISGYGIAGGALDFTLIRLSGYAETSEMAEVAELVIYPNPASDVLNIEIACYSSDIKIVDSAGQLIYTMGKCEPGVIRLDVSNWPPGLYTVEISGDVEPQRQKFIIQ
jgi:uncharacterized delta-60 repeat protein